jgi:hypothetical protein
MNPERHGWVGYPRRMGFFRWLYRLPGRINRSFGPTVAATGVEGTRHQGVNPVGVTIVAEEIRGSARSNKVDDDEGDNPTAD